ncbi:thrombospondin-1 like protein golden goal isoform 2-T9 [Glossina fuscipes fuscipes]
MQNGKIGIYKKSSARVVNGDKKSNSLFAMCGYNLNNSSINRNIKSSSLLNLTEEVYKTTEAKNIIITTTTTTTITKAAIHHKAISLSRSNAKRNIANAYVKTSYTKWQIVILTFIILLLCCTSHVLAIRKGRLMTPSTFTALSGDLHVQIQFMQDDDNRNINSTATISTTFEETVGNMTTARTKQPSSGNVTETKTKTVENIITSTLVISKYIDEVQELTAPEAFPTTTTTVALIESNDTMIDGKILQRKRKEIVQNIPVYPDPRYNVTQIAVPCQTFIRGGLYEMQVVTNLKTFNHIPLNSTKIPVTSQSGVAKPTMTTSTTTLIPIMDERLKQTLDVRWPSAEMLISPVRLRTYPDRPVEVTLRFPEVNCDQAWRSEDLPEFWLELIYCGKERPCSTLMPQNISKSSVLFAEQVRGYPKYFNVKLNCELFGLAGNYAVQLRPMLTTLNVPITRRFLSVDWSEKYVFNVYARSIFPCDPHTGIGVLYEYPGCILEQGDRVRLYAKLRADVASLKPPTTLHYIAEQRVVKNQYSLYFSCDLFTEKYVEYCFVYVSQAISGAVADVRMDCVPTLPVRESDTGGWGPWSEWTPCSTSCLGGTRNRYRFCDSPPPRYGAKFCEGASVQTEKCGNSVIDTWDCIYESGGAIINNINRTGVSQEIGPGCRCGCIVHLGSSKPKRIIAGATQSCPGRSFWLIQVDGEEYISMELNFLRLPCATQYIKVRDGPSLSSTLLTELQGGDTIHSTDAIGENMNVPLRLESGRAQLLLEFFAGEESSLTNQTGLMCTGGFLANVEQLTKNSSETSAATLLIATGLTVKSRSILKRPQLAAKFTLVHVSAIIFASIIILISALLGAQYVLRYRKYHLAVARSRDEGSRLHTPRASMSSLQGPPSRALSTTTLISEVIYMVKMRPKRHLRHSILRESIDAENLARETELNDSRVKESMVNCVEEFGSNGSIITLRNAIISPITETLSQSPSYAEEILNSDSLNSAAGEGDDEENVHSCGTLTRKDSSKDNESIVSSGMSSICYSPSRQSRDLRKYSEATTLKLTSSHFNIEDKLKNVKRNQNVNSENIQSVLTNGCYSSANSVVSTATIRSTTNPKANKDKQNRKKLLTRPGSEFSLGNPEDFELDYYDYNVTNAGSVPGSYLGMDPAYLIWVPPFDEISTPDREDADKTPRPDDCNATFDETQPLYEEIKMPKYSHYLSPHSNTDSSNNTTNTTPTSEEISPLNSNFQSKATTPSETDLKNSFIRKVISASSTTNPTKSISPYLARKRKRQEKQQSKSTLALQNHPNKDSIALQELNATKSARNVSETSEQKPISSNSSLSSVLETESMNGSYIEKETSVVKSPSDLQQRLALDDIQYADESESDHDSHSTERNLTAKERLKEECQLLRNLKKIADDFKERKSSSANAINMTFPTSFPRYEKYAYRGKYIYLFFNNVN